MSKVFDTGGFIGLEKKYLDFANVAPGEAQFTVPGTYIWPAPAGVTSVSVLCVGAGGGGGGTGGDAGSGGGGGALSWKNNITVVPGQNYTVNVGLRGAFAVGTGGTGGQSFFSSNTVVSANGGVGGASGTVAGGAGGTRITGAFDGGGNGGQGGNSSTADAADGTPEAGAGGGAGGYTGTGGRGAGAQAASTTGSAGTGGAGGGGGSPDSGSPGGGGGVGILGAGSSGAGGTGSVRGGGGSGGTGGTTTVTGGLYGGGGGGADATFSGDGANGAVRIIWGANRQWPNTNTANAAGNNIVQTAYGNGVFNLDSVHSSILRFENILRFVGLSTGYALDSAPDTATISFNSSTQANDLAVVWLRTDDAANNKLVPTDWTLIANTGITPRGYAIAKRLTSSDLASPPTLLSVSDTHAWICLSFRGGNFSNINAQNVTTLDGGTVVTAQTIQSGSSTSPRTLVIGMVGCKDDFPNTSIPSFGGAEDGFATVNFLGTSMSNIGVVYKIFNSTPTNVTRSSWTGTTDSTQISFYLGG